MAWVLRVEPVIGVIIDAAPGEGGPALIAFASMVVDDVENHFDAGGVQAPHGLADFMQRAFRGGQVRGLGREIAQCRIAPVIAQVALHQKTILQEGVDREQFDGGDAEALQMLDDPGIAQACETAALVRGDMGVALREAADMRLVDHGLAPVAGGL